MSEYEEILKQIRPFGPFQIRTFILVSLFETPLAWAMLVPVFTAANPGYFRTSHPTNNETELKGNCSSISQKEVCNANASDCPVIAFKDDFSSIVTEWNLVCSDSYIGDLITSIQMAGVLVGALITGQLADVFGRKKILFAEYALLLIFWLSTAFAPSWQVYAALRFFVGGLVGGCLVVNFVLPLEFVTPEWRTLCGCIGFWAVGLMTLSPWAYYLRDWKILNIAMSTSSVVLLLMWWFVDESPRWLLSRGRIQEAEKIIIRAAQFNNMPVPDMSSLQEFYKGEQFRKDEQKKYSYWHLFSSCHLAVGTLICMFGWFVSSSVYYGHNFNSKNLAGNIYLNVFLSGIVEIPALLFVLFVNNRLGRRLTTFLLMLVSGLACFSILVIDQIWSSDKNNSSVSLAIIIMAMIGKASIAGGWAAVQILSAETFPTVVRNIGIGACSMAARIGGIVAPQFVFMGEKSKIVPFTIFGVLAILCSLLVLLLKETVGKPLPDRLHKKKGSLASFSHSKMLLTNKITQDSGEIGNGDAKHEHSTYEHISAL